MSSQIQAIKCLRQGQISTSLWLFPGIMVPTQVTGQECQGTRKPAGRAWSTTLGDRKAEDGERAVSRTGWWPCGQDVLFCEEGTLLSEQQVTAEGNGQAPVRSKPWGLEVQAGVTRMQWGLHDFVPSIAAQAPAMCWRVGGQGSREAMRLSAQLSLCPRKVVNKETCEPALGVSVCVNVCDGAAFSVGTALTVTSGCHGEQAL